MTIRFHGYRKFHNKKEKLESKRQSLCRHHVEKAQDAIHDVLNAHLTTLPFMFNTNGTTMCQIQSRNQLKVLLDNYRSKTDLINRECTQVLNEIGAADKLGLINHEFLLHVHINERDIKMAVSYFEERFG